MSFDREIFEQTGALCSAWAYLEHVSETTLWGVLGVDEKIGSIIASRLDMRGIWEVINSEALDRLPEHEVRELKSINKDLITVTRDRNIIVHGRVNAVVELSGPIPPRYSGLPDLTPGQFTQNPCWTIYKGAPAKKNYPVSKEAVLLVLGNVQKLSRRVEQFNLKKNYPSLRSSADEVEADWPVPLK